MKLYLSTALILVFCSSVAPAATAEEVLAKMNAAAPKFSSMTANIQRVTYTKVLDEKTTESGTIRIRKQGKDLQVFMEVLKPDPKLVAFRGRKAEIFLPRLKPYRSTILASTERW